MPTTTLPVTTTSEPTTASTTVPPEPELTMEEGGTGEVFALQVRLADLGYDVGRPDGRLGERTRFSIQAFQKIEGLTVDGLAGPAVLSAVQTASPPRPRVPGGASTRVEIDLDRQVLLLWEEGGLARVLPVSTGNGEHYCVDGECDVAITPTGTFRVGRKYPGVEVSRLGELYHPMYFYLGWAIHGSPSVPAYPASHGCVRIPMYASTSFYAQVPSGTLVYVVGDGPPVGDPLPDPPTTTTTQASSSTTVPPVTTTTAAPTSTSSTTSTTSTTVAPSVTLPTTTVP